MKATYRKLLDDVTPQSLNMIESFGHSDNVLNSCIGNYYGDIYEQ